MPAMTTAAKRAANQTLTNSTEDELKQFSDDDLVTVLYRYGDVASSFQQNLGETEFTGGVALDVPFATAKHWLKGTREIETEDGRILTKKSYFRVNNLYVLPSTSTAIDWAKKAKIKVEPTKVAAMINATDLAEFVQILGEARTIELIEELKAQIVNRPAGAKR